MGVGNAQYPWVLPMGVVPEYVPIPTQISLGEINTHSWVLRIYIPKFTQSQINCPFFGYIHFLLAIAIRQNVGGC